MNDLPDGWASTTIGEVAAFGPKHPPDTPRDQKVAFVPMPAVNEFSGEVDAPQERELAEVWSGYTHFRSGDVICAKITPCMENGKAAVVRHLPHDLACGSTEFHVLRPGAGICADYLWRFLRQKTFREDAEHSMTGAVGQRRVPADFLKQAPLPVPPTAEQRRIVAKVDSLSAKSSRARDHLDDIPRLVEKYKEMIVATSLAGSTTQHWRGQRGLFDPRRQSLSDVAEDFSYGSAAKSAAHGSVPVLRMGNIQGGRLDWSDLVYTSDDREIGKFRLRSGDVLFNRTNSPALVGKTALFRGEREAIYAGYLIRIRCTPDLHPAFLSLYLNSPLGRAYCWSVKTDGVSQSNINARKIAAFEMLVPTIDEQREIVRRIEAAFAWIDRLAAGATSARKLVDRLDQAVLAKAFRGKLVPQDPTDEPASALLARIKAERTTTSAPSRRRNKAT